ncbi:Acetyltransferase [Pararobbsia alpina]|uniref:GNAT family N-acetyltransferase n=1 Tax=Pararobbsia alpina TaxID=621374 RepID=UPI0039A75699
MSATNDRLVVRPLAESDAEAFQALRLKATVDAPFAIWPTYEEEAARTRQEVEASMRFTSHQFVYGAFDDQELVAIAGLRRVPLKKVEHKATLWGVFVEPSYRRSGIARRLLSALIVQARASDIRQVHLAVGANNPRARALYESLGFKSYGIEPNAMLVDGQFIDEELMIASLS